VRQNFTKLQKTTSTEGESLRQQGSATGKMAAMLSAFSSSAAILAVSLANFQ